MCIINIQNTQISVAMLYTESYNKESILFYMSKMRDKIIVLRYVGGEKEMKNAVSFFRKHVKRKLAVVLAGAIIASSVNYLTTNVKAEEPIVVEDFEGEASDEDVEDIEIEEKSSEQKKEESPQDDKNQNEDSNDGVGDNSPSDGEKPSTGEIEDDATNPSTEDGENSTAPKEDVVEDGTDGGQTTEDATTEEATTEEATTEETTTEEVTTEETTTEELEGEAADVRVILTYETGVFPENVTLEVSEVTDEADVKKIENTVKKEVTEEFEPVMKEMVALDVTVLTETGDEVEPDGEVKVTFKNIKTYTDDEAKELKVFHMSEDLDKADDMSESLEAVDENVAELVTDGFSVYTIIPVSGIELSELVYEDDVFKIGSADELQAFADLMKGTGNVKVTKKDDGSVDQVTLTSYVIEGSSIKEKSGTEELFKTDVLLTKDIDLGGIDNWEPITVKNGSAIIGYSGNFDGDGHRISGMNISNRSSKTGLFYSVKDGTIEDLTVDGKVTVNAQNPSSISGVVGFLENNGRVTFSKVTNSVDITVSGATKDTHGVGGLLGRTDSGTGTTARINLIDCKNEGTIDAPKCGYLGGLIGKAMNTQISMENCENTAQITGLSRVGGLIGVCQQTEKSISYENTIINCKNNGVVTCTDYMAGGILGANDSSVTRIEKSENNEVICSGKSQYIGGIVGQNYIWRGNAPELTITDCNNNSDIDLKSAAEGANAGGIIGATTAGTLNIFDSANNGNVEGTTRGGYGGLVGSCHTSTMVLSRNTSDALVESIGFTANDRKYEKWGVGGVVGSIYDSTYSISNNTINGIVRAQAYAGGMAGAISNSTCDAAANNNFNEIVAGVQVPITGDHGYFGGAIDERYTIKAVVGVMYNTSMTMSDGSLNVVLTETLEDGTFYEINYAQSGNESSSSRFQNGDLVSNNYIQENKEVLTSAAVYEHGATTDAFGEDMVSGTIVNHGQNALAGVAGGTLTVNGVNIIRADTSRSIQATAYNNTTLPTGFAWVSGASNLNQANMARFSNGKEVDVNVVFIIDDTEPSTDPDPDPEDDPDDDPDDGPSTGGGGTTPTGEVLGATRAIPDGAVPLAATPDEAQVLGAERNPQTGDNTEAFPFVLGLFGATALLAGWSAYHRKRTMK